MSLIRVSGWRLMLSRRLSEVDLISRRHTSTALAPVLFACLELLRFDVRSPEVRPAILWLV